MMEIRGLIYFSTFIVTTTIIIIVRLISLEKRISNRKVGLLCESVYINQLKELESRVAFLELRECDIKDFIEYGYDTTSRATVAKSEQDYGAKIRVGKEVLYRQQITQTNQKYYEYDNQMVKAFKDIRRSDWNGGCR